MKNEFSFIKFVKDVKDVKDEFYHQKDNKCLFFDYFMKRRIVLIGVPSNLGVDISGSNFGPDKIRQFLIPELEKNNINFVDLGNLFVSEKNFLGDSNEKLKNLTSIQRVYRNYSRLPENFLEKPNFPIILGGDHSIIFGHIKELTKKKNAGLIWFDAHGDFNDEFTTLTGNIHGMVLGAIAGNSLKKYFDVDKPLIKEKNISLLGARDLDLNEIFLLKNSDVMVISTEKLKENKMEYISQAINRANDETSGYHVSFDLDFVDPLDAPGVSVPVNEGISKEEFSNIVDLIDTDKLLSVDFVELNPLNDIDDKTVKLIVDSILKLCK
ncbi:MAG TPA: arginase [Candidatus Nanoarchaeia archaeon]|nr:arginase [Candidatus Nanoarchaeia archaeon]